MGRIARIFGAGFIAALPLIITVAVSVWLVTLIIDYAGPSSRFEDPKMKVSGFMSVPAVLDAPKIWLRTGSRH